MSWGMSGMVAVFWGFMLDASGGVNLTLTMGRHIRRMMLMLISSITTPQPRDMVKESEMIALAQDLDFRANTPFTSPQSIKKNSIRKLRVNFNILLG
jgi:hypothetical protein